MSALARRRVDGRASRATTAICCAASPLAPVFPRRVSRRVLAQHRGIEAAVIASMAGTADLVNRQQYGVAVTIRAHQ